MPADGPDLLTTGQAAKLCSVTPDTVLKWIKKGRIAARRTAGGHYRIERRALDAMIVSPHPAECPSWELADRDPEGLHCWEYLSDRGTVRDQCRQCVVYRVRAARCFLMAGLEVDVGHAREFCQGSCEECVYYRWVKGLLTNILVITPDDDLIDRLLGEESKSFTLRFARSAYEASSIVQSFQAAFVVVDEAVLPAGNGGLLASLADDSRLPGVKVILGVPRGAASARRDEAGTDGVWSVIEKPFSLPQLAAAIAETEMLSRRGHHARSRG
ncbi:MAG: helix-turn-helix domain-containing protein [Planctomycetota bacterium]